MIYVTGDIHGEPFRFSSDIFPEQKEMTKNDYVIILGDFGLLWENTPSELEKELLDFYNNFGCPILWLDGNQPFRQRGEQVYFG